MKITLVVGLPASGKTTYASEIGDQNTIVVDDPRSLDQLPKEFHHLIITDPHFCIEENRQAAETILSHRYPMATINWVFFENNPQQCLRNAKLRPDKKVDDFIKHLSKEYRVPQQAKALLVFTPPCIATTQHCSDNEPLQ